MTSDMYDLAHVYVTNQSWDRAWVSCIHEVLVRGGGNFLTLWRDLGPQIGLAPDEASRRGVALYYWFCTLNLVDDVMDGDCDYVEVREQPLAILALCNLVQHVLTFTDVSPETVREATRTMGECIDGQYREAEVSDFSSYAQVGDAIAGQQFEAYLTVFCDGTGFEDAGAVGRRYGRAAHVLADIDKRDPRLLTLPNPAVAVEWGAAAAREALAMGPPEVLRGRLETAIAALAEPLS